jgi:hypothetical protein
MVSLVTANPRTLAGVTSYDISMKNISTQTIFAPMRLELASITSASGTVTVANADNSMTGVGANWDYSSKLGADNALTVSETSAARTLRFNNPRNEVFTVTFNVIGNLPRGSTSSMTMSASSPSSGAPPPAGGSPPSDGTSMASAITSALFQLTYNPLLNTVTVQLIKP